MADLRGELESSLSNYSFERELGGGGMARVFVAVEKALGRRVVIKVLAPELAAEVSTRRFEREIMLAASLQHPNIVPVLAAGEANGLPHYAMPFVEGQSLRQRLEGAPLPLRDAIGVLRDVARALAYAHERGVVHRDIKPENILLSGDAAVVTDFGIAKAIASARRDDEASGFHSTVTQAGTIVGTPAYMAPEQIAGDPGIDHRVDLYAFGCVAFEVLAGTPPFKESSVQEYFTAHLSRTPPSLIDRRPDAPATLAAMVASCLEKDPAHRPQSARAILDVLDADAGAPTIGLIRFARRLTRPQRLSVVVAAAIALGLGAWQLWRSTSASDAPPTVVVLPFVNLSDNTEDEYLADGMADGLTTALGKIDGIRVASRTLGYRYRGRRDIDARSVGRALAVTHVLHGTVQRAGNRLRVSAQLTSAHDNLEVWSSTYDRGSGDAFAVQDEITRLAAAALPRRLAPGASADLPSTATSGTSDAEAYDLYLRGRFLLQRRGGGVRRAIENFERAIALDPGFARAHAAYALALQLLPYFTSVNVDSIGALAIAAAERALAADSTIAEAHTALAMAYQHRWQWARAEQSYRRAVAALPPDADAHVQYGRFLFYTRTLSQALPFFERAQALDPTSAVASAWVGHVLEMTGRVREGLTHLRRAIEIDSTNPPSLTFIAMAHVYAGNPDSARVYAERLGRVWPAWRGSTATVLALLGDHDAALRLLRQRQVEAPGEAGAAVYAALGDSTRWFEIKERDTAARTIWPTYLSLSERHIDFMRGSARFAALVRSVGLDESIFTSPNAGRR